MRGARRRIAPRRIRFRHLAQHPDCWMRSIKELHYFDMIERKTEARALRILTEKTAALRTETGPRAAVERSH